MESAFGVEHTFSKGMPRAVANGGGGIYGSLKRLNSQTGKIGAKHPFLREAGKIKGKHIKGALETEKMASRVKQSVSGKGARSARAALLNADSASRRAGYKTGKTSALNRGYRGRVSSKMTALP